MAQALLAGACAICWGKIIRAPVPSVEKTLYYTLTLKQKLHLNLFQRCWWVKSVYIFLATLYMPIPVRYLLTAMCLWLQAQRSSMEHQKVRSQSTSRIQLQRRSAIRGSLVKERLVTHRPAEAQTGNGRRPGKHRSIVMIKLDQSRAV